MVKSKKTSDAKSKLAKESEIQTSIAETVKEVKTSNEPKITTGSNSAVEEGKRIAIISYITWIGLVIAFIMNNGKKNTFAKFHMRQSILLNIAALIISGLMWIPFISWAAAIAILVFAVLGIISAVNGEEKKLPFVGEYAQEWFRGL